MRGIIYLAVGVTRGCSEDVIGGGSRRHRFGYLFLFWGSKSLELVWNNIVACELRDFVSSYDETKQLEVSRRNLKNRRQYEVYRQTSFNWTQGPGSAVLSGVKC